MKEHIMNKLNKNFIIFGAIIKSQQNKQISIPFNIFRKEVKGKTIHQLGPLPSLLLAQYYLIFLEKKSKRKNHSPARPTPFSPSSPTGPAEPTRGTGALGSPRRPYSLLSSTGLAQTAKGSPSSLKQELTGRVRLSSLSPDVDCGGAVVDRQIGIAGEVSINGKGISVLGSPSRTHLGSPIEHLGFLG
jgi:hypothetical protein